jgi:hypothetical protein
MTMKAKHTKILYETIPIARIAPERQRSSYQRARALQGRFVSLAGGVREQAESRARFCWLGVLRSFDPTSDAAWVTLFGD